MFKREWNTKFTYVTLVCGDDQQGHVNPMNEQEGQIIK